MEEVNHILDVLRKVSISLKEEDYVNIKRLSNEVIHNSSINQDPDVISVAIIIYSLSKIIEREHYKEYKNWEIFYRKFVQILNASIKSLEKNDLKKFRKDLAMIRILIEGLSGRLKIYLQDVFRKAQINKASRIYDHGISMEKTAKILGISIWELAEYAGQSKESDIDLTVTLPIKDRIKTAMEFFK